MALLPRWSKPPQDLRRSGRRLFSTPDGLIALEGLAHLGFSEGKVVRLTQGGDGRWKSVRWVDLGQAPYAGCQDAGGSLLVVTSDKLLRVHRSGRIDGVLSDAFWRGLSPNSLVLLPSGVIYIGMRHGVARVSVERGARKVAFLLPNRAFVKQKPAF